MYIEITEIGFESTTRAPRRQHRTQQRDSLTAKLGDKPITAQRLD